MLTCVADLLLSPATGIRRIASRDRLKMLSPTTVLLDGGAGEGGTDRIKRVSSSSSISSMGEANVQSLCRWYIFISNLKTFDLCFVYLMEVCSCLCS